MRRGGLQRALAPSSLILLVLLCITDRIASAFVVRPPPLSLRHESPASATQLCGVRSALKRRFGREKSSGNENNGDDENEDSEATSSPVVPLNEPELSNVRVQTDEALEAESLEQQTVAVVEEEAEVSIPVVRSSIPDRDEPKLSSAEREFRGMMKDVNQYTPNDVRYVEDPRWRALLEGAMAGSVDPAIYRAFEVCYQDLVPLRVAGRMIFGKMQQVMENSQRSHQEQVDSVATTTGLSVPEVETSRFAFLSVAEHKSCGSTVLNIDQLVESGVATTVVELLGYDDFEDFLDHLDEDKKGEIMFEECMVKLQQCPVDSPSRECNPATVLEEIAKRMEPPDATAACERKKKYADRYDGMVESFLDWEDRVPEGEGRRLDVLRGCFVGARNQKVLEALKIVYMDYSALRFAGDTIFSLMKALIRKR